MSDELNPTLTTDEANLSSPIDQAAASDPKDLDPQVAEDALDWFMEDDETADDKIEPIPLELNVAPLNKEPRWITLGLAPINRDELKSIRRSSTVTNGGETTVDETEANLQIAVSGIVQPDLRDPQVRQINGRMVADRGEFLLYRFRRKPGLIDQIASAIMEISGFSDKDVKEITAAKN